VTPRGFASGVDRLDVRTGLVMAAVVLAVFVGIAAGVGFPRAAMGFKSDEATYYMMGHSLAEDFDLTYRRDDLARVWREFPAGPTGVFLKRGKDFDLARGEGWMPARFRTLPDPDPERLFYGKSFIYPLVASPFVWAFGTNGFLVFHALLLALMTLAAYLFLQARTSASVATLLAGGYIFGSVAPVYYVWITPELFNLGFVLLGYFLWLFKEVARDDQLPRGLRWLVGPSSDIVAAVLLGLATFSKPSNVLLVAPPLLWMAWRGRWRHAVTTGVVFGAVVAGLFAANIAVTGEWNFQGGDRVTCYVEFPFQTPKSDIGVCMDRATDRVLTEVIFNERVFAQVFSRNLLYFFLGRHSGAVPYFFPCVFAMVAFLLAWRRREPWQWLVLAVGLAEIVLLLVWIPYNYFGGAGVVGNRYFMNTYGVFLFLLPPFGSVALAAVPWVVGALFTAQITLNPFVTSFSPASYAKQGPVRWLPVELTLVNDLPVNTDPRRVRILYGSSERFQIYYLDDNAYDRERDSFWVKGESTAEMLVKAARPLRQLTLKLSGVPVPDKVVVRGPHGFKEVVPLRPKEERTVVIPLGEGFPYQGTRVWWTSVTTHHGFVPFIVDPGFSTDSRFLGVLVTPDAIP
jgi:hypothetical protein